MGDKVFGIPAGLQFGSGTGLVIGPKGPNLIVEAGGVLFRADKRQKGTPYGSPFVCEKEGCASLPAGSRRSHRMVNLAYR
jgi:hypothetical protein